MEIPLKLGLVRMSPQESCIAQDMERATWILDTLCEARSRQCGEKHMPFFPIKQFSRFFQGPPLHNLVNS